jgi:hypothetical protein
MTSVVLSETYSGFTTHLRIVGGEGVCLAGHVSPVPKTLCGAPAAWDVRDPIHLVGCNECQTLKPVDAVQAMPSS